MKKIQFLGLITSLIFIGCDSDGLIEDTPIIVPEISYQVENVTPLVVKIGDTISLTGKNLSLLPEVWFMYEDKVYSQDTVKVDKWNFLTKNDSEITFVVPEVFHEKMLIQFDSLDSFKQEIVGVIPTINDFNGIDQIQVLDSTTVFLLNNNIVYKSTDGFYKWDKQIVLPNKEITSFFFLNENMGWFGVMDEYGRSIYQTVDGGNTLNLKFQVNNLPNSILDGSDVRKIQFSTPKRGLFKDGNLNVFIVDDNTFKNIYDFYPSLSSLPFGQFEIWDFSILKDDLIFLAPNDKPNLIKIDGQDITYSDFNIWPLAPVFFGNTGYVQVNSDIFKSMDLGNTWSKVKTFENYYPKIGFLDDHFGFAFVNYTPEEMFLTKDGGVTWETYFTFPQYHGAYQVDFTESNGFIGSYNGKTWKFRREP